MFDILLLSELKKFLPIVIGLCIYQEIIKLIIVIACITLVNRTKNIEYKLYQINKTIEEINNKTNN